MATVSRRLNLSSTGSLDAQMRRINQNFLEVVAIEQEAAEKGLLKTVTFIQGEAQEITPQKTGRLVGSAFSSVGELGGLIIGRVGYAAQYAPTVHEMPDPLPRTVRTTKKSTFVRGGRRVNWTKPGTGNKFLEKAVKNNQDMIIKFLREFLTLR